jgi:hypothetical protein
MADLPPPFNPASAGPAPQMGSVDWAPAGWHQPGLAEDGALRCRVCGATPATYASFVQNIGMIYVRRHLTTASDFCRHCGLSVGRKVQGKTLLTGWTGLISFVMNIGGIAQNGKHLRSLAKLSEPMGGDPSRRMAVGHPMFKRPLTYVPIAGLALITGLVIKEANKPNYAASVGACVHFNAKTERLQTVGCSEAHEAKITAIVATEAECPSRAVSLKLTSGRFACALADG